MVVTIANFIKTNCRTLSIEPHLLQIPCYRLQNPIVQYDKDTALAAAHSGRWNLQGKRFLRNGENTNFHYVFLVSPSLATPNDTFRQYDGELFNQLQGCGVGRPVSGQPIFLPNVLDHNLEQALEIVSSRTPRPNVVILLLPSKDIPLYSKFKYLADRLYGLQSICVTESKCFDRNKPLTHPEQYKKLPQYMGNVAMKANLKRGGVNHASKLVQDISAKTLVLGVSTLSSFLQH